MNDPLGTEVQGGKVVYLHGRTNSPLRHWEQRALDAMVGIRHGAIALLVASVFLGWQMVRLVICAVLTLLEPFVRLLLASVAFFGLLLTVFAGLLMGDPRFPTLEMFAVSIAAVLLYWLYLWVMGLFMKLPHGCDRPY